MLNTLVVCAQMSRYHREHSVGLQGTGQPHLLQISPIFRTIEERLEYRQVRTGQKRDCLPRELLPTNSMHEAFVNIGGIEKQIERCPIAPQAHLSVTINGQKICVALFNPLREGAHQ